MGGQPPLGYDVKDRKLIVNEAEAKTVQHIFSGMANSSRSACSRPSWMRSASSARSERHRTEARYGGKSLARGALYLMLQNRIYRGEIVHKDKSFPGEHEAIVERALWDKVQAILAREPCRTDQWPNRT